MPRKSATQWEFGELFAPTDLRQVMTVSELTTRVRSTLEKQIGSPWVRGEVTNLRQQSSGHLYFTLKDAGSQLNCVFFRGGPAAMRRLVENGRQLLLHGDLTVYEPRGQYQLIVREAELEGAGALQVAFEKLKAKLDAEGLFDPARKRVVPAFPRRIGIVTSPTGAALRDVLHVIQRRYAGLEIVLVPVRVQGDGAGAEIAGAIERLNRWSSEGPDRELDLILVTRGGGSMEDLWAFNEECVARAIAASTLPVVSAVGHEIDFTISDFVADLRAATPSAAAEILTQSASQAREVVAGQVARMRRCVGEALDRRGERFEHLLGWLRRAHPRRRLEQQLQYLDDLRDRLRERAVGEVWERGRDARQWIERLVRVRPSRWIGQRREQLTTLMEALPPLVRRQLRDKTARLQRAESALRLLSPEQTLARGYSITTDARTGRIVRKVEDAAPGQRLRTRVSDGEFESDVLGAQPGRDQ